jgi:hypothetical protein
MIEAFIEMTSLKRKKRGNFNKSYLTVKDRKNPQLR